MGVPGGLGAAGGGGRRGRILEKQKIKMSKMAATAAIFCILVFLFFENGHDASGGKLAWLQVGHRDVYDPPYLAIA